MDVQSDNDMTITFPGQSSSKKSSSPHRLKSPSHLKTNRKAHMSSSDHSVKMNTSGSNAVSFSTNSNSVVCLPLVSEGLKLVWTQSDQTKELDAIPALVQAFNVFPYPTSQEVSTLAHVCALPLDKVKVWFMVQRIKYGISWASEDIEETRCKLAGPECASGLVHEESKKRKSECDDLVVMEEKEHTEDSIHCLTHLSYKIRKKEPPKLEFSPSIHFHSIHSPVENLVTPLSTASSPKDSLKSSLGFQQKHGRYKKSKAQLIALRKSFLQENWPSETELRRLQEETGLSRNEIRKWFSDSRYQLRNGRGMPRLTCSATQEENELQHQPLSLVTDQQQCKDVKGGSHGQRAQRRGSSKSGFFQVFLSNTLKTFGEGEVQEDETKVAHEVKCKDDGNTHHEEVECERYSEAHESRELPEQPISTSSSFNALHVSKFPGISKSSKKCAKVTKANTTGPSLSCSSSMLTVAGRVRKTKEQLNILKEYFLRCPWPKSEEYTQLVKLTSLPRADVIQWFGDTRYAVKNGHLRWVHGIVRDQILTEIALQQNAGGAADSSSSNDSPKNDSSSKCRSQSNNSLKVPKSTSGSSDLDPLELYHQQTGALQEKDLDVLCQKSKMSYQQVRDWFSSKESRH